MSIEQAEVIKAFAALAAAGAKGREQLPEALAQCVGGVDVDASELQALAARLSGSEDAWKEVLSEVKSPSVRALVLREAYFQAYLDDVVEPVEQRFLDQLCSLLELPQSVADRIHGWVQRRKQSDAEWAELIGE